MLLPEMFDIGHAFDATGFAILRDDLSAGHRATIVAPAERVTSDLINTILHLTGGLPFVALSPERTDAFGLDPMARSVSSLELIGFKGDLGPCVSVDAREGITTGISAADRAAGVLALGSERPTPRLLVRPGHLFPVRTQQGGVLASPRLAEGALDLVQLAGYRDAALYLDLLDEHGELMTTMQQDQVATRFGCALYSLSGLVRLRLEREKLVQLVAEARLPVPACPELRTAVYRSSLFAGEHVALVRGDLAPDEVVLIRVQTEATFNDVFGGDQPNTRNQISQALKLISEAKCGVLLYLRQASSGVLACNVATKPVSPGQQSVKFMRDYGLGAQILYDLGVRQLCLLTNSSRNFVGLEAFGLRVVEQRRLQ